MTNARSTAIAFPCATEDGPEETLTVHRLLLSPRRLEPEALSPSNRTSGTGIRCGASVEQEAISMEGC